MSSSLDVSTSRPPELRSVKEEVVVKFTAVYEHYIRPVTLLNENLPAEKKFNIVGPEACIAPDLLMFLAELVQYGATQDLQDVTHTLVQEWLDEGGRYSTNATPVHVRDALDVVKCTPDAIDLAGVALTYFFDILTEL